jgi:hypothetical protein
MFISPPTALQVTIRDQALWRLSKLGLQTGGHVYYIHDLLDKKFRDFLEWQFGLRIVLLQSLERNTSTLRKTVSQCVL